MKVNDFFCKKLKFSKNKFEIVNKSTFVEQLFGQT